MYNLNKPLRSKKGALELSINAIVVLILAITMLSLGLAFMKGLFKKTTGQLEQVGEDIKNQMIEQLRTSSAKLTLNQEDITMKKGEEKDVYFAIKNVDESSEPFSMEVECPTHLGDAELLKPVVFDKSRSLEKGEIDVQKMKISVQPTSKSTTHSCELSISRGGPYAKKSFFVTVE